MASSASGTITASNLYTGSTGMAINYPGGLPPTTGSALYTTYYTVPAT